LAPLGDLPLSDLLWQAAVGAWPFSRARARAYAQKASREAGIRTSWTSPNEEFEARLQTAVDAAFDDPEVNRVLTALQRRIRGFGWSNSLSAKLVQLTMPGVPDVYQGTEFWDHSLVDPDNRRPVDFQVRHQALAALNAGTLPPVDPDGNVKLLVVSRALRLRRDRPELFTGYEAVAVDGPAADHAFGFDRGGAITLVTRLPLGLARDGGWRDTAVALPPGTYHDAISGAMISSDGSVPVGAILGSYPVALLVADAEPATEGGRR
jgi:(1->4)-alpha-D-glucan 1-alpha-D-glucosylmutase